MGYWLGLILIAPMWGMFVAQFVVQAWFSLILVFMGLLGVALGKVSRSTCLALTGANVITLIQFSVFIFIGDWLLRNPLAFTYSDSAQWVLIGFAAMAGLAALPEAFGKLILNWRYITVPYAFEDDMAAKRLGSVS